MKIPCPQRVEVPVFVKEFNDLRILHISDLHIDRNTSNDSIQELVETCRYIKHDFIVISGDIIDDKIVNIHSKLIVLNSINSKVFYISGNHDLFYGIEELTNVLDNFIFMDNEFEYITFNEHRIYIAGLPDRFSVFFKKRREIEKVSNFLQNRSATILISHQPKDYKIAVKSNVSLFLCGHTHGGQIFPFHFLVRLVQPFLKGLHYKERTAIYVNSGLGTWGINKRFKAPNEITLLKMRYLDKSS